MKNRMMIATFTMLALSFLAILIFWSVMGGAWNNNRCDLLAAHPDDRQRTSTAPGVQDASISLKDALHACSDAALNDPSSLSLRFQLARVLYALGNRNDAEVLFQSAADEGYDAAYFYLGEMQTDIGDALANHLAAASGGFQPSLKRLKELEQEIARAALASPDQAVMMCDEEAAHPMDDERPGDVFGVMDENLDPEAAIEACLIAEKLNPSSMRMKFQLGRSLILGGLQEEGGQKLMEAAKDGYEIPEGYLEDIGIFDNKTAFKLGCETFVESTVNDQFSDSEEDKFNLEFFLKDGKVLATYDQITTFNGTALFQSNWKYAIISHDAEKIVIGTNNFATDGTNDNMIISLDDWTVYHYQGWHTRKIFGGTVVVKVRFYGSCAPIE